jgi:AraC-like DNA-binding protein
MNQNICLFIPRSGGVLPMQMLNFVYETKQQSGEPLQLPSTYRCHYVMEGEGELRLEHKSYQLLAGDIFFTLPAVPYAIRSGVDFKYAYVTYLGERAVRLSDELGLGRDRLIFRSFPELKELWKTALSKGRPVSDLRSEGVLLYTLSVVRAREEEQQSDLGDLTLAVRIRSYIDEHYSDSALSLQRIGAELSYNPKYISALFKKTYRIGVAEYMRVIRIQSACTLIGEGLTAVSNIAFLCGFDDPLYFSKLFRIETGLSPREYIRLHGPGQRAAED